MASDSAWIDGGTASGAKSRVALNCTSTNAVDASIAHALKRMLPIRAITFTAPTT
jgi:hypothetical protein